MQDTQAAIETPEDRFESADIPTLRRALLADAQVHADRARDIYRASSSPIAGNDLAAWSALALADGHNRLIAALLGMLGRPGVPDSIREEARALVGGVLDGWVDSLLEGAHNDDLTAAESESTQAVDR